MPDYYTPFVNGEPGSAETFNSRFDEIEQAIDGLLNSLLPAIVPFTALTGAVSSITIDDIPQTFGSLKLIARLRTDQAATKSTVMLRLNNDSTAASYYAHQIESSSSVVASTQSGSGFAGFDMKDTATAASATTGLYGLLVVELVAYPAVTTRGMLYSGYCQSSLIDTAQFEYHAGGGNYMGAAALTRLDIVAGSGSFIAGSEYALYGII